MRNYAGSMSQMMCGNVSQWSTPFVNEFNLSDTGNRFNLPLQSATDVLVNCPLVQFDVLSDEKVWDTVTSLRTGLSQHHVQFLFSDPDGWLIREYAPTPGFFQLVANIGGSLGIWTGSSLVSLLHLFICLFRWLYAQMTYEHVVHDVHI